MIHQKQLVKVEYFKHEKIKNDDRRAREIKSRIFMAKAAFNKKEKSLHRETGPKFKEEYSKLLHLGYSFVWCRKPNTSESRSDITSKF
jgi:hypothetical protein